MITTGELVFVQANAEIELGSGSKLVLVADPYKESSPSSDVEINGAVNSRIEQFTDFTVIPDDRTGKTQIVPAINYALASSSGRQLAYLVGRDKVVVVDAKARSARHLLTLFRSKESYDVGFKHTALIGFSDDLFIVYELGIARIRNDGTVAWHVQLFSDDLFEKIDSHGAHYSSESEGDWVLRMDDGAKTKKHTV